MYGSLTDTKMLLTGTDAMKNLIAHRHGILVNAAIGAIWFGDNCGSTYEYYHSPFDGTFSAENIFVGNSSGRGAGLFGFIQAQYVDHDKIRGS